MSQHTKTLNFCDRGKLESECIRHAQVKTSAQQRRRLKQLHWDKIRAPQQGTVWARDNQPRVNLNFDELENLFQARILHFLLSYCLCRMRLLARSV